MNADTGEIKSLKELTGMEKKSGKWAEIPKQYENKLRQMNRKQRRKLIKEKGYIKKGRWGFLK